MKKTILITIVCLLIPSFGIFDQASASNFSIEGTLWSTGQIEFPNSKGTFYYGFYEGDIYVSFFYGWYDLFHFSQRQSYGDLGTVSYFFMIGEPIQGGDPIILRATGCLMFPPGFGILFLGYAIRSLPWAPVMLPLSVLRKIEDNWDPSGWVGGY